MAKPTWAYLEYKQDSLDMLFSEFVMVPAMFFHNSMATIINPLTKSNKIVLPINTICINDS